MKKLYIIKLGGSVVTQKNRKGEYIRKSLLKKIAENIKRGLEKRQDLNIILIHGAGSVGHQFAQKHKLADGTVNNRNKLQKALKLRMMMQKLNVAIGNVLLEEGLSIFPISTSSVISQDNKKIASFDTSIFGKALGINCIPLFFGDVVIDDDLEASICSGDAIAAHLAQNFKIGRMFFASDVDGIFTKDPHVYKDAELIQETDLKNIFSENIKLSSSHNVDVTDGIRGKFKSFTDLERNASLKEIVIFNGLKPENYSKVLLDKDIKSTRVKIK